MIFMFHLGFLPYIKHVKQAASLQNRQIERSRFWCSLAACYSQLKQPYLSSTPRIAWEVIKRLAANQRHGNCTPAWFSRSRPLCLRRITANAASTLGRLAGREYPSITYHRHIRNHPIISTACPRSLLNEKRTDLTHSFHCHPVSSSADHGAAVEVAYACLTIAMEKYLMNGSLFVKEH